MQPKTVWLLLVLALVAALVGLGSLIGFVQAISMLALASTALVFYLLIRVSQL